MYKLSTSIVVASALLAISMGANASDLPVRAAPPPPMVYAPPPFTWTGFYIGGIFGGAWARTTLTANLTGARGTGDLGGLLGGGRLGFNFLSGRLACGGARR